MPYQKESPIIPIMYISIATLLIYLIYSFIFANIKSSVTIEHFRFPFQRRSDNFLIKLMNRNKEMIMLLNNKFNQAKADVANISKDFYTMNREIVNNFYRNGKILFEDEKLSQNKKKIKASILNSLTYDPKKTYEDEDDNTNENNEEADDTNDEVTYRRFKIINFVFNQKANFQTAEENNSIIQNTLTNSIKIINNEMKHFFAIPMDHTQREVKELHDKLEKMNEFTIINKLKKTRNLFVSYDKKENKVTLKNEAKQRWLLMFPEDNIYGDNIDYTIKMHLGTLVEIVEESFEDEEES